MEIHIDYSIYKYRKASHFRIKANYVSYYYFGNFGDFLTAVRELFQTRANASTASSMAADGA